MNERSQPAQLSTEENLVQRLRDNRGDDPVVTGRLEEEAANALAGALNKLTRIAALVRAAQDGDAYVGGTFIDIEAICHE